ncbi:hypothetical protein CF326_g5947 [Tilletia indica]|nr:hypothetical protein CF326_g5947 [Tilletia indica]
MGLWSLLVWWAINCSRSWRKITHSKIRSTNSDAPSMQNASTSTGSSSKRAILPASSSCGVHWLGRFLKGWDGLRSSLLSLLLSNQYIAQTNNHHHLKLAVVMGLKLFYFCVKVRGD